VRALQAMTVARPSFAELLANVALEHESLLQEARASQTPAAEVAADPADEDEHALRRSASNEYDLNPARGSKHISFQPVRASSGPVDLQQVSSLLVEPEEQMQRSKGSRRQNNCYKHPLVTGNLQRSSTGTACIRVSRISRTTRASIFPEPAEPPVTTIDEIAEENNTTLGRIAFWITEQYGNWRMLREPRRDSKWSRIVSSQYFRVTSLTAICLDSIFNAYCSEYEMENLSAGRNDMMRIGEWAFLGFYTVELFCRMAVHGTYYFCNKDMAWNMFDFGLVAQAYVDKITIAASVGSDGRSLTFVRLLRLLKIGRIFRMFRALRFLRELRVLIATLMGSVTSMLWCIITLVLILYVFGLIFVQSMSSYLMDNIEAGTPSSEQEAADIQEYFSSVPRAMLTLYMCTNGGVDWYMVHATVATVGALLEAFFIFFICFFNFAVLNILSGIFLEKALRNSEPDRHALALERQRAEREDAEALRQLFHSLDFQGEGTLCWEELEDMVEDHMVRATFESLGIDVKDAEMFFEVLTHISGSDIIVIEDFVDGCSRMKGTASATDMASLSFQLKVIRRDMRELLQTAEMKGEGAQVEFQAVRPFGADLSTASRIQQSVEHLVNSKRRSIAVEGDQPQEPSTTQVIDPSAQDLALTPGCPLNVP